ncbi:hypothetical protein C789_5363 [Microcystis aeruginosa FACHB-905 = DIANCHI905]|uniref:Uncharacterized protein n=1 Tax=Microcystis aeruginosa PCC 7806SL TaxID=1903187 RepID=A0AB33BMM9_MICA7|nr:hypothetical protein BH695_0642 [Microcystis aeruginosa PCC 7806SL]ELS44836.1 hypothetical protein C789_5363 [Microcystis aeruginosa FACHB-905 = DIANCHI905]
MIAETAQNRSEFIFASKLHCLLEILGQMIKPSLLDHRRS